MCAVCRGYSSGNPNLRPQTCRCPSQIATNGVMQGVEIEEDMYEKQPKCTHLRYECIAPTW